MCSVVCLKGLKGKRVFLLLSFHVLLHHGKNQTHRTNKQEVIHLSHLTFINCYFPSTVFHFRHPPKKRLCDSVDYGKCVEQWVTNKVHRTGSWDKWMSEKSATHAMSKSAPETRKHSNAITARGKDAALCLVLKSDNSERADAFLLGVNSPAPNNQKSNPDHNSLLLLTMLSTYRACQFHSTVHQCLSSSLLITSVSSLYQWEQGQISTPTFYLSRTRIDRKPLYWMSPSSVGSGPHSRMRYVTWATEVAMFPVCEGAWRLMGNEGDGPFVLPLKGLVG